MPLLFSSCHSSLATATITASPKIHFRPSNQVLNWKTRARRHLCCIYEPANNSVCVCVRRAGGADKGSGLVGKRSRQGRAWRTRGADKGETGGQADQTRKGQTEQTWEEQAEQVIWDRRRSQKRDRQGRDSRTGGADKGEIGAQAEQAREVQAGKRREQERDRRQAE